ncbi:hypothetical protein NT01EI_0947 [Edwardsiella ictaluri 93-146]|uniref:Uncharacterized protein n=1 Tax=Edwardsiella ictaluri (strain 93-146) TaxID=634503 RepID=C5B9Q8_EDWI9|nr:hypothetical protein NT01EI_0947 [Edwardsiella ictaluri 93-146]
MGISKESDMLLHYQEVSCEALAKRGGFGVWHCHVGEPATLPLW